MTKEQETQLLTDVHDTKEDVAFLKESLLGDPRAKPKATAGLVQIAETHKVEIYGDPEKQHVGMKKEIETLKNEVATLKAERKADRNWILATASGISTGIGIAWFFAQLWFGK